MVGAGLLLTVFPGQFATMNEASDAVGSERSGVAPAQRRVLFTRVIDVGIAPGGAWFLIAVDDVSRRV